MPGPSPAAASVPPLTAGDRAAIDDLLASYVLSLDVDDIDATLIAVEKHGGAPVGTKMDVGGMGSAAYFTDSEGNLCGIVP